MVVLASIRNDECRYPNSIKFTEDLEIGYYSGEKVEIKDKDIPRR